MGSVAFEAIKSTATLPTPTGVALRILRLAQDTECTVGQIAEAVASDPALSGRLLKLVNSPLAGVPRFIASITHAAGLLGIRSITSLALGFSLVSNNRDGACAGFDYDQFWSDSLARAVALRQIEESRDNGSVDQAFVCGLLSSVGRLAFATAFPEKYAELIAAIDVDDLCTLRSRERDQWSLDHCDFAAEMLRDWRFPDPLCEAVLQQKDLDGAVGVGGPDSNTLGQSLRFAGAVAGVLTSPSVTTQDLAVAEGLALAFGLSPERYGCLFNSVATEWQEMGGVFSIGTTSEQCLDSIYVQARACQEKLYTESRSGTTATVPETQPQEVEAAKPQTLIVDDDPTSLLLLRRHLEKAGFPVRTATSGEEAMQILMADGPPIVITDWQMPGMDGLELCGTIRGHEGIAFTFVIMVTGHEPNEERLVAAFDAGADDYLSKPIKSRELLARLHAGVRIINLQTELDARSRDVHRNNAEMEIGNARLACANQELNRMATTDELTGLINRREAMVRLAASWADVDRHEENLSVIAMDIDRFKSCNDIYGHAAGDAILKETAAVLRRTARQEEAVCRIGGEEFLVICPRTNEAEGAIAAERLRAAVEANSVAHGGMELGVTVSLGVAQRTPEMTSPDDLLRAGDNALYAAKDGGRNMTCCAMSVASQGEAEFSVDDDSVGRSLFPEASEDRTGLVLIVDDDEKHRRLCEKYLANEGHRVQHVTTAEQAMIALEQGGVALVMINAVLPGGSGVECARAIKTDPVTACCPVILTGVRGEALESLTDEHGVADEYLGKPVDHRELIVRVRTMLRLRREMVRNREVCGEQTRALDLLLRYSREIAVARTLNEVLEHTVDVIAELSGSQGVAAYLLDEQTGDLTEAMSIGRCDDVVDSPARSPGHASSEDLCGLSDQNGRAQDSAEKRKQPIIVPLLVPEAQVGEIQLSRRLDGEAFTTIDREYLNILCNMAAASIHERLTQRSRDDARHSIVVALAKLAEHRDTDTGKHLDRVTRYAVVLAQELRKRDGFSDVITDEFIDDLQRAVPLHDIGKVAVPDDILLKPGSLSDEEWGVMKTHTTVGADTICSVLDRAPGTKFLTMAEQIARHHHEWFDGTGYPDGLVGDAIPLAARITSIADAYDVITTSRPYKKPVAHERAIAIIKESTGTQFDPSLTSALLAVESQFKTLGDQLSDAKFQTDMEEQLSDAALKLTVSAAQ